MRKGRALLLFLGLTLLVWLVWKIGAVEIWKHTLALGWGLLPLILSEGLAQAIHTLGWRCCLLDPQRSLPFRYLFRVRMAGYAINCLTPTAMLGGDATKAVLLASNRQRPPAVAGMLLGKLCFAAAHVLFVLLGSWFIVRRLTLPRGVYAALLPGGTLAAGGVLGFLWIQRQGQLGRVLRWLLARGAGGRAWQNASGEIREVDEALKASFRDRSGDLVRAVGWHLLGFSVGILQTGLFLRQLNYPVSAASAAAAWSLGMWFDLLIFAMPLNLGTMEATRIVVFNAMGCSPVFGMTYALALRFGQLLWAAFGLANFILLILKAEALTPGPLSELLRCQSIAPRSNTRPRPGRLG